jgi:protocatechuate 3,4-dioxygenase beta subunit
MRTQNTRLSRREAIAGAGAAGLGAGLFILFRGGPGVATAAVDAGSICVLAPEQTEGPYYINNHLVRRNITEGKAGTPLQLRMTVVNATTCKPIRGATVEIWHADALGNYSGFGSGGGDGRFLRGGQVTNSAGVATIDTIYPGWYRGRTVHIHVKVHAGGRVVHTGQLFFPDATSDAAYRRAPYSRRGARDVRNSQDGIYGQGGKRSTLALGKRGSGYVGRITMGIKA